MGNALRNKGDKVRCNIYVHFDKSLLFIRCKRGKGWSAREKAGQTSTSTHRGDFDKRATIMRAGELDL